MVMAWELGVRRLEIQHDSTAAINILMQNNTSHQHASLVARFHRLRERLGDGNYSSVPRG
ncbi:hypothetical protein LINPERPRIM_LOCUS7572 [Linum perenne]